MGESKTLDKWDEWAKLLIIELLNWAKTGGFDLDSVYFIKWKYYVIEFLKCDSKLPWVTPFTSHPNRYWKNKQKFISLWNITEKLNWDLYLINYEILENSKIWDNFKLMKVLSLDENSWITTDDKKMNLKEIKEWWWKLNKDSLNQ